MYVCVLIYHEIVGFCYENAAFMAGGIFTDIRLAATGGYTKTAEKCIEFPAPVNAEVSISYLTMFLKFNIYKESSAVRITLEGPQAKTL